MQKSKIRFVNSDNGYIAPAFNSQSLLVRRVSLCAGLEAEQHKLPPFESPALVPVQHTVHIQLSAWTVELEHKKRKDWQSRWMLKNDICFYPAHQPIAENRWHQPVEIFSVGISPAQFSLVLPDEASVLDFAPCIKETDLQIQGIITALKAEAEQSSPNGKIFAESLMIALCAHLIKHYSSRKVTVKDYRNGLSPYNLKLVTDYLEENIDRETNIQELATLVKMSRFHFVRQFKLSTGQTPYQYILRKRLETARALVCGTKLTIAQIAARVGFYDQSHLNQHFKRFYRVSPAQLRIK